MKSLTRQDISDVMEVQDGLIVWRKRDAEFYLRPFCRAYDAENAAKNWNRTAAGLSPAWRYDAQRRDFTCTAMLRTVTLKAVCTALGVPYDTTEDKVRQITEKKRLESLKNDVKRTIVLKNGVPVWKTRTEEDFPKTGRIRLNEFNAVYAGRKLKARSDGTYKVRYSRVTLDQIKEWVG